MQIKARIYYQYNSPSIVIIIVDMQPGQMQKYQAISKLYKEIVDSITTLELPQLKLYLINLQKRIKDKTQNILADYQSAKELLDSTKQAQGKVPLHFACAKGNVEIVRYLIETVNLDFRIRDKDDNTPFFTSIEHGHFELVRYFIQNLNCSANETKEGSISPLHLAANHNHTSIMTYLLSKGADIEKISIYGKPINWAVGGRNFEATKLLLDHGANPNGDSSGSSVAPLILAVDCNNKDIYQILVQKGANIHIKDPNGYSILHVAAEKGDLKTVKDLIQRGADLSLEVEGKTPLYLAFEHSNWEVVSYLKEKMPNHEKIEAKWKEQTEKRAKGKVQPNKQRAQEIKIVGNKFYSQKQYEQALSEYLKALTFDEDNEIIHKNIAACQLALKQYDLALFHCQQAKKKDPRNLKTLYREAQAHIGLNNLIEASSSMWECCLIQPHNQLLRNQFQKLVEQAKSQHAQSKK